MLLCAKRLENVAREECLTISERVTSYLLSDSVQTPSRVWLTSNILPLV